MDEQHRWMRGAWCAASKWIRTGGIGDRSARSEDDERGGGEWAHGEAHDKRAKGSDRLSDRRAIMASVVDSRKQNAVGARFPHSDPGDTLCQNLPLVAEKRQRYRQPRSAMTEPQTVRTDTPVLAQPGLAQPPVDGKYVYFRRSSATPLL